MSEVDKESPSRELKGEWGNAKIRILDDGKKVVYVGERLFPPVEVRDSLLDTLHSTHKSTELQVWNTLLRH